MQGLIVVYLRSGENPTKSEAASIKKTNTVHGDVKPKKKKKKKKKKSM